MMLPEHKKRLQEIELSIHHAWSDKIYKDVKWLAAQYRKADARLDDAAKILPHCFMKNDRHDDHAIQGLRQILTSKIEKGGAR